MCFIGMPDALLRMKIASEVTLSELEAIFNDSLNAVLKRTASLGEPLYSAQESHPDLFLRPVDNYMRRMLQNVVEDTAHDLLNETDTYDVDTQHRLLCYIGNMHVDPIVHAW